VIDLEPAGNVPVVQVAFPATTPAPMHNVLPPSKKLTVPEAGGAAPDTVAVNTTGCAANDGLMLAPRTTAGLRLAVRATPCIVQVRDRTGGIKTDGVLSLTRNSTVCDPAFGTL
jgi:hypothetical protein